MKYGVNSNNWSICTAVLLHSSSSSPRNFPTAAPVSVDTRMHTKRLENWQHRCWEKECVLGLSERLWCYLVHLQRDHLHLVISHAALLSSCLPRNINIWLAGLFPPWSGSCVRGDVLSQQRTEAQANLNPMLANSCRHLLKALCLLLRA